MVETSIRRTAMMRAWHSRRLGIAGLELTAVPRPDPGPTEALARVEAAALNFSDLLMIDDRYQIRPERPFIPGQEIAGTVVAAGDDAGFAGRARCEQGGRRWACGIRARSRRHGHARAGRFLDRSGVGTAGCLYHGHGRLDRMPQPLQPGETVLVLAAAGGVGLAAVEIARHLGARVIAAAGGAGKCALAQAHGAHETLDYRDTNWADAVKGLTGGNGVDVIVDPVGGEYSKAALRLMNWGARLLVVGFSSGEIPQIPANRLLLRRACADRRLLESRPRRSDAGAGLRAAVRACPKRRYSSACRCRLCVRGLSARARGVGSAQDHRQSRRSELVRRQADDRTPATPVRRPAGARFDPRDVGTVLHRDAGRPRRRRDQDRDAGLRRGGPALCAARQRRERLFCVAQPRQTQRDGQPEIARRHWPHPGARRPLGHPGRKFSTRRDGPARARTSARCARPIHA